MGLVNSLAVVRENPYWGKCTLHKEYKSYSTMQEPPLESYEAVFGGFIRLSNPLESVASVSSGPRGLRMTELSFFDARWTALASELVKSALSPKILFRAA